MFTWLLFEESKRFQVSIGTDECFDFELRIVKHENCREAYQALRDKYLDDRLNSEPSLETLSIGSRSTVQYATPKLRVAQKRLYYRESELGRGNFGVVHKVRDVSTGEVFAMKTLFDDSYEKEVAAAKKNIDQVSPSFSNSTSNPWLSP